MSNILPEQYYKLVSKLEKYKSNEKIKRWIMFGLVVLLVILFIGSCNKIQNLKNDNTILEQNQKALADSLRTSKNKIGDLEKSINILVADKKNLKELNADLASELEKEKGKVSQLNKIIAGFKHDTVYIPTEIIIYKPIDDNGTGIYGFQSKYDTTYDVNNYRKFEVLTKFELDTTFKITPLQTMVKDEIGFDLVTGLREKDGNIEIFARSNYPDLVITDMQGAIIDPKKHPVVKKFTKPKKFGIGPYIGVGINGNQNSMGLGVHIGFGVTYSLIQF